MAKIIETWAVHHWDGGDRHNFAYYMDQSAYSEAEMKALLPKTSLLLAQILAVFESMQEVEEANVKNARRSAWQKLTPLERLALKLERPPE